MCVIILKYISTQLNSTIVFIFVQIEENQLRCQSKNATGTIVSGKTVSTIHCVAAGQRQSVDQHDSYWMILPSYWTILPGQRLFGEVEGLFEQKVVALGDQWGLGI